MISSLVSACLNLVIAHKKRRITQLSRAVMQAKRRDDRCVLNRKLAFAHLSLGRALSLHPDAGNHLDPLWRELKLAVECYDRGGFAGDEDEHHRLRSVVYQRAARITMRMAYRSGDRQLCEIAEQQLDVAAQAAHLARHPGQQASVRTSRYELARIMEQPRAAHARSA